MIVWFTCRGQWAYRAAFQWLREWRDAKSGPSSVGSQLQQLCDWILDPSILVVSKRRFMGGNESQPEKDAQKRAREEIVSIALERNDMDMFDRAVKLLDNVLPDALWSSLGKFLTRHSEQMKPR
jgi:hypothetical protein